MIPGHVQFNLFLSPLREDILLSTLVALSNLTKCLKRCTPILTSLDVTLNSLVLLHRRKVNFCERQLVIFRIIPSSSHSFPLALSSSLLPSFCSNAAHCRLAFLPPRPTRPFWQMDLSEMVHWHWPHLHYWKRTAVSFLQNLFF